MSTWAEVEVGDVVRGKEALPWIVTGLAEVRATKQRSVTLRSKVEPDKTWKGKVTPGGTVVIVEKGAPAIPKVDPQELAVAVVKATIGTEVLSEKHGTDPILHCPKEYEHPGSLLAHLYVHHAIRDLPTHRKDAEQIHTHHPEGDALIGYVDHTHDLEKS